MAESDSVSLADIAQVPIAPEVLQKIRFSSGARRKDVTDPIIVPITDIGKVSDEQGESGGMATAVSLLLDTAELRTRQVVAEELAKMKTQITQEVIEQIARQLRLNGALRRENL